MNLLHEYINLNIVLSIAAVISFAVSCLYKNWFKALSSEVVSFHYKALFFAVVLFLSFRALPEGSFNSPVSRYYDLTTERIEASSPAVAKDFTTVLKKKVPFSANKLIPGILFVLVLIQICLLIRNLIFTLNQTKNSFTFKKYKRVRIVLSDKFQIPYAFSFMGYSYISVPLSLLCDKSSFKLAVKHEIQHIRSKDTSISYLFEIMRALFFINPIITSWINKINLEQEFSCDEALLSQRSVKPQAYASCLLKVAELEPASNTFLVGATGILFARSGSQLKRRINRMKNKYNKIGKLSVMFTVLVSALVMTVTAHGLQKKSELTVASVNKIVNVKDFTKGFPVVINKEVVKQLNNLTRTRKGKKFFKGAMKNYKKHEPLLKKYLKTYSHPEELLAVPFVESKFTNPPQKKNSRNVSAGMWQFIPTTARNFGLQVDKNGKVDERTDISKETDAAMKYLKTLNLTFNDWSLAILSYNAGEGNVREHIKQSGSRDPWVLMQDGLRTDKDYLAKVIAASIAMKYQKKLM